MRTPKPRPWDKFQMVPTSSVFSTNVSTIIAATAINTAMGGTPSHDSSEDSFSCVLKCHGSNGDIYCHLCMIHSSG